MMQDASEGKAIYCQKCLHSHFDRRVNKMLTRNVILGSITKDFEFTISTKQGWYALVGTTFTLKHECGYIVEVSLVNPSYKQTDIYETA